MTKRMAPGRAGLKSALVFVALCVASVWARAAEPTVLAHVCARDLKALGSKLQVLGEKLAPGEGGAAFGVLSRQLEQATWRGVDWARPVSLMLLGGEPFGKPHPLAVFVVALADADQFGAAREAAGQDGVQVDIRGKFAVLGSEQAALAAITPARLEHYSKFPAYGADGDVYATLYVASAVQEYQAEIDETFRNMEGRMGAAGQGGPPPGPRAFIAKMLRAAGGMANVAGKQVHRISMVVTLAGDAVELRSRIYPVPGSEFEAGLKGQPAEMTDLAKYLPSKAVAGFGANLDFLKTKPLFDVVLNGIAQPLELTDEDRVELSRLMFASTQTGEFAMAFPGGVAGQGMQTATIARIGDGAKYRAVSKEGMAWFARSGYGEMLRGMGLVMTLDHKANARQHAGVEVDRITISYQVAPDAPPQAMMMGQLPDQATEVAALDTLALATSNDETGAMLDALIDRAKGDGQPGLDTSPAYKAALQALPKGASMYSFVLLNSALAKFVEQIAKQQPAVALMLGGVFKEDLAEQPITGWSAIAEGRIDLHTRIPHEPVVVLVSRFRAFIEQQRPGARPPGKGNEPDF